MTTENLLDDYSLIAAEQARPLPIHARNSEGMEYLHSEGVLHGDLKGANVLVDSKYRCCSFDSE